MHIYYLFIFIIIRLYVMQILYLQARPQAASRPTIARGFEPPQPQSVNAFRSYIMIPESFVDISLILIQLF
jgi:hypothetical protein